MPSAAHDANNGHDHQSFSPSCCAGVCQAKRTLPIGPVDRQDNLWWRHFLNCMKQPRGGARGAGSQQCLFEYSCPSDTVLKRLLKGLQSRKGERYNQGDWQKSSTIDTYYAFDAHLLDHYMALHRREAAKGRLAYRASHLVKPCSAQAKASVMVIALPPLIVEVCHRSQKRCEIVRSVPRQTACACARARGSVRQRRETNRKVGPAGCHGCGTHKSKLTKRGGR